ncbi:MAG: glycine cleavage T C-terminal barrel domain-containing protein [Myxococcota bacterium]
MAKALTYPLMTEFETTGALIADIPWPSGKGSTPTVQRFGETTDQARSALLHDVAIADLTGRSLLRVTGNDRLAWLHGLCTQEIKRLEPGQGAYACHVDIKGKIQTDLRVSVLPDGDLLLDLEPGESRRMRRTFKRYIIMEDVKVSDVTQGWATLGLFGPGAAGLLHKRGDIDLSDLPTHHVRPITLAGHEVWAVASDLVGVAGFRLVCPRDEAAWAVWQLLSPPAIPAGFEALEAMRIRFGRPKLGPDLHDGVLFNEALLSDAVSFTKGCYLGQEVVERVDARGRVGRKLLGLKIMGTADALPAPGSTIANTSRALGQLTSVAWHDDLGYGTGLGLIHRADNAPGTSLLIRPENGPEVEAIVTPRDKLAWNSA